VVDTARTNRRNYQKVGIETIHPPLAFLGGQVFDLRIYQQRLLPGLANLVRGKQQLERVMRLLTAEVG